MSRRDHESPRIKKGGRLDEVECEFRRCLPRMVGTTLDAMIFALKYTLVYPSGLQDRKEREESASLLEAKYLGCFVYSNVMI